MAKNNYWNEIEFVRKLEQRKTLNTLKRASLILFCLCFAESFLAIFSGKHSEIRDFFFIGGVCCLIVAWTCAYFRSRLKRQIDELLYRRSA